MRPLLRYHLGLFLFVFIAFGCNAQTSLINQLNEVNSHWKDYTAVSNELNTPYKDLQHEEKIKLHLLKVEKILREKSMPALSKEQLQNRNKSLDVLKEYTSAGVFPQNTNHPNQIIPYFIDKYNTACAVGHLIRESGNSALPSKIHKENNYGYMKELVEIYPEINSWAAANGFTIDELAWIQPQYGSCKYEHKFPGVFGDSVFIQPSQCTQPGFNGCSNMYENGYFILDSNGYPGLTPPISGTFYLQGYNPYGALSYNLQAYRGGTYFVTIKDVNNNTAYDTITIPTLSNDVVFTKQTTPLTIGSKGKIKIDSFMGGTGLYSVWISRIPNVQNTYIYATNLQTGDSAVLDNLTITGKYQVVVRDQNTLCEIVDSIHLTGSMGLLDSLSDPIILDSVRCNTDSGTVIYTAFNTTTNYSITDTFRVPAGGRIISFIDSANLQSFFGVVHPITPFTPIATVTPPVCYGEKALVTISAPNAQPPVTNTGTFLKPSGSYSTILVSADGCSRVFFYNVPYPQNSKINLATGSAVYQCPGVGVNISPTFIGGTAPYSFTSTPASPGYQKIFVSDSLNCTDSFQVQLIKDSVWASATITQPVCYGSKGEIIIHATNSLNTFSFTDTITKSTGNYNYVVADPLGCKDTVNYTINSANSQINMSSPTTLVKCKDVPYNFNPIFTGGIPPYNYTPSALSVGTQKVYITDNANCVDSFDIQLINDSVWASAIITQPVCFGSNGEIIIHASNSLNTFSFADTITNSTGNYNYIVTDAIGCKDTVNYTINSANSKIDISSPTTLVKCKDVPYNFNPIFSGGAPPYTFTPTSLSLGSQQVYITDNANCTDSTTISLQEDDLDVNVVITNAIKCNGEIGQGEIVGTGSYPPFTGIGNINFKADSAYTFTLSDASGCSASIEKTFDQPQKIFLTNEKITTNAYLKGTYLGEIKGGTPPYKYQLEGLGSNNAWENAISNSMNLQNLNIGRYNINIKDANDCIYSKVVLIGENINTNEVLSIFPNPFTERIYVLLNDFYNDVSIRIFNANGQNFYKKTFAEVKQQDITLALAAGMYFVEISSPKLSTQVIKIIRE